MLCLRSRLRAQMTRADSIKCHHRRFAENAFRTKGIFFRHIKLGRSVLGAMAAWASKMDMFNHNVNLVWVMFC
ncbi:hypothetical protein BN1200_480008 [Klebsiella variicola]|nr:hypothetical protein BN1200_480008 [Klebsiella variicola]CTQ21163.1 hypothetical protein BN1007_80577 [Klebsiella variicola]CTQ26067.1 hypothetical protein BN1200_980004 [Klebsiella variicola]